MATGKNLKNVSVAIMILGLIFMMIAFVKSYDFNYVLVGLVVVSLGSFLNRYAQKQKQD